MPTRSCAGSRRRASPASAIHGNKSQPQRERALAAFRAGTCRVLVATDIAARGIDVDGVTHVINFDLPNVPESYVHRIGRTARAGASGVAISFCNDEERAYLRDIEKLTRLKVPVAALPDGFQAAAAVAEPHEPSRAAGQPRMPADTTATARRAMRDPKAQRGPSDAAAAAAKPPAGGGRQNEPSPRAEAKGGDGFQLAWLEKDRRPRQPR